MTEKMRVQLMRGADSDFLDHVSEIDTVEEVLEQARLCLVDIGITRMSYHFNPPFHSQTSERTVVITHGFPESWIERYADSVFRASDPIPNYVMSKHKPMSWQRALRVCPDREKAMKFKRLLRENGFGLLEGIGIPLFGPGGRDAYSSFSIDRTFTKADRPFVRRIRAVAQSAHLRVSHLVLNDINDGTELSMRESEVLSWVIASKSQNDIATILDISPATVDTYLRRVFVKLKVNDRIKASLSALSRGLVKL